MKHYIKLLLVVFLFGSLNAGKKIETSSPETKGLFESSVPSSSDMSALIEDLDILEARGYNHHNYNCCPPKRLNVCEICAKKIYVKCLEAKVARIKDLFAKKAKIERIWSKVVSTCNLCAYKAKIDKLWVDKEFVKDLYVCKEKVDKLWANDICFDDLCTKYKADLTISTTLVGYNLGTDIAFNTIVDDPNHNASLNPSYIYTVPKTGYYVFTLAVDGTNLQGADIINGAPITVPSVWINGTCLIATQNAYLTFSMSQRTMLTAVAILKKDDVLSARMDIMWQKPGAGLVPYVGTVDLLNGKKNTFFIIHYLSSNCYCKPCDMQHCECSINYEHSHMDHDYCDDHHENYNHGHHGYDYCDDYGCQCDNNYGHGYGKPNYARQESLINPTIPALVDPKLSNKPAGNWWDWNFESDFAQD
ncbi:hypothetical protein K9L05_03220 [Candidatus Babeliales bacterium]|nr:hypothetical protein [Candidatus Babeliales bacterium]MCF7899632.1 hypothetical protein [Candidatus Babeliales bacterium]